MLKVWPLKEKKNPVVYNYCVSLPSIYSLWFWKQHFRFSWEATIHTGSPHPTSLSLSQDTWLDGKAVPAPWYRGQHSNYQPGTTWRGWWIACPHHPIWSRNPTTFNLPLLIFCTALTWYLFLLFTHFFLGWGVSSTSGMNAAILCVALMPYPQYPKMLLQHGKHSVYFGWTV